MECMNNKVAYKIILMNVAGADILKNIENGHLEDHMILNYKNTHFDYLESEVTEEHYRHGIQSNNFKATGIYNNKPFTLNIEYLSDSQNVVGDFTEEEKTNIIDLGYGEDMYYIMGALDKLYRIQNPNTPKLHRCTC